VRLICGDHILSEADNWYVPARPSPEMNRVLDKTDTAFGRAVQTLNFRRRTLSAKLLWSPLPGSWEMDAPQRERRGATLTIPHEVLEHRADAKKLTLLVRRRLVNAVDALGGDVRRRRQLVDGAPAVEGQRGAVVAQKLGVQGLEEGECLLRRRVRELWGRDGRISVAA
jgi:hypothetical protein